MKKVLIQDNFGSLEHIDSLKDLLDKDINNKEIELDFAYCLNEANDKISSYDLVISHPHIDDDNCCLPVVKKALNNKIKVLFLYKFAKPHGEAIEAVAQHLKIELIYRSSDRQRETYYNAIKKYLL